TGIGMEKRDFERIFERFYRVDKSRSKRNGGTGLGLSIVKHAAKYHGAVIRVESELGKGSVFTVVFTRISEDGGKS
ncbi:MAG: two-component sensor histidine kinase, partial [Treponema sp.]|nr:two-component sensor histidine kinase [Treponema sp.]